MLDLERPEWQADAACRGFVDNADWERVFFPGQGDPVGRAKRFCARCPVREDCLAYALDHPDLDGIWGGTSDRERRRIRRYLADRQPPHTTDDTTERPA